MYLIGEKKMTNKEIEKIDEKAASLIFMMMILKKFYLLLQKKTLPRKLC